jgi:hypothetical protein
MASDDSNTWPAVPLSGWDAAISVDRGAALYGRGFVRRDLICMRCVAALWSGAEKVQPPAAQIGWAIRRVLLDALDTDPNLYGRCPAGTVENRRHTQTRLSADG